MIHRYFWIILCVILIPLPGYAKNIISSLRFGDHQEYTRFVLDTNENPSYRLLILDNPHRIALDIFDTSISPDLKRTISHTVPLVKKLRTGRHGNDLRIVLDLTQAITIRSTFIIPPDNKASYRLVLDISPKGDITATETAKEIPKEDALPLSDEETLARLLPQPPQPVAKTTEMPAMPHIWSDIPPSPREKPALSLYNKKPLIIIDPGHGGQDPGAIGKSGKHEKMLTLSYAKSLGRALENTGKYRAMLTRYDDTYIRLDERVSLAKQAKGDLFISIHADSHPKAKTRGLSIYTLSDKASDKEAAALAANENKSDIISGVDLDEQSDEVASILIDFVQKENQNASSRFAETLVSSLKKEVRLLNNAHRFAGFRVLTAADIPSALVELGYLSNNDEERLLQNPSYKKRLVNAMVQAIDNYFIAEQYFDTTLRKSDAI